ncbi:reticulon B1 [Olea europaea subsp. europaea]|uniref:Reticulon-like protein n=1 Tax=Olea europaea subsp. europaea TaxID=158383 RepID=A0A8S0Q3K7_OLEEU|nr:reticulon B1 [Olea europaea subsp. europaea]
MIKEEPALKLASALRIQINQALATLKLIASGKDLKKFLWVNGVLVLVLTIGATVFLFTLPLIYDKYGYQINSLAAPAMAEIKKYYGVIYAKVLSKIPIGESKN